MRIDRVEIQPWNPISIISSRDCSSSHCRLQRRFFRLVEANGQQGRALTHPFCRIRQRALAGRSGEVSRRGCRNGQDNEQSHGDRAGILSHRMGRTLDGPLRTLNCRLRRGVRSGAQASAGIQRAPARRSAQGGLSKSASRHWARRCATGIPSRARPTSVDRPACVFQFNRFRPSGLGLLHQGLTIGTLPTTYVAHVDTPTAVSAE